MREAIVRRRNKQHFVMPGLVPGISVFKNRKHLDVDGRDKPGRDCHLATTKIADNRWIEFANEPASPP
jgi:hypothetical protein